MGEYCLIINTTKKEYINPIEVVLSDKNYGVGIKPPGVCHNESMYLLGTLLLHTKTTGIKDWAGDNIEIIGDYGDTERLYTQIDYKKHGWKNITEQAINNFNQIFAEYPYAVKLKYCPL